MSLIGKVCIRAELITYSHNMKMGCVERISRCPRLTLHCCCVLLLWYLAQISGLASGLLNDESRLDMVSLSPSMMASCRATAHSCNHVCNLECFASVPSEHCHSVTCVPSALAVCISSVSVVLPVFLVMRRSLARASVTLTRTPAVRCKAAGRPSAALHPPTLPTSCCLALLP
jgi:hypothetical protein